MEENKKNRPKKRKKVLPTSIKLTEKEHKRLREDKKKTGLSVNKLIRNAYFKSKLTYSISQPDAIKIGLEIDKLCNEFNKILLMLWKGLGYGCFDSVDEVSNEILLLRREIANGVYDPD